jgi:hypothetical protein
LLLLVALCQNHFFSHARLVDKDFLKILNRHILCERNLQLNSLFLIHVYFCLKFCPSLLDITVVRDFTRSFINSNPFPAFYKTSLLDMFLLLIVCTKTSIA